MSSRADATDPIQERARSLILPGGKVDPDAVRLTIGEAASDGEEVETEGLCRVTFRLSRDLDKRLDKYLTDRIPFMSRTALQRLIDEGGVTVNGRKCKAAQHLHLNDVVEAALPPPPSTEIQPEDIPIEVLFEDDSLIVVNKQPGLIVHPARSHLRGTLLNALVHHFRAGAAAVGGAALSSVGKEFARPGVVHRLDKHTSGVMVVAKEDTAHWRLGRQFELRQVEKRYIAIVHGLVEAEADVIEQPIGPHPSKAKGQREKQIVRHDEHGKPAVTVFRVRERLFPPDAWRAQGRGAAVPEPLRRGFSVVELDLKTGRTHQIRVHMSHFGHPLVGDDMYGGAVLDMASLASLGAARASVLFERQALHAAALAFRHPISEAPLRFTAPLARDLHDLLGAMRAVYRSSGILDVPGSGVDRQVLTA